MPPNGDVTFQLSQQSGDFTFTPGTSSVIVQTAGVYFIQYGLLLRPSEGFLNAAYAVTVNGAEHPYSYFGLFAQNLDDSERRPLAGAFIAALEAGAVLTLRNKSISTDSLAGTGVDLQAVNRSYLLLNRIA